MNENITLTACDVVLHENGKKSMFHDLNCTELFSGFILMTATAFAACLSVRPFPDV
jgi:hypothetical protein